MVDDWHDQQLPVPQNTDHDAQIAGQRRGGLVTDGHQTQTRCNRREERPDDDFGHFDQQEGVEIHRLADADLPDFANGEDGDQITSGPSHNNDKGVQQVRPQKQPDRAEEAHMFSRAPHARIQPPRKVAQHHKERDGDRNDRKQAGDRFQQYGQLRTAEARENLAAAFEPVPERGERAYRVLADLLGDQGDLSPDRYPFGIRGFGDRFNRGVCITRGGARGIQRLFKVRDQRRAGVIVLKHFKQGIQRCLRLCLGCRFGCFRVGRPATGEQRLRLRREGGERQEECHHKPRQYVEPPLGWHRDLSGF